MMCITSTQRCFSRFLSTVRLASLLLILLRCNAAYVMLDDRYVKESDLRVYYSKLCDTKLNLPESYRRIGNFWIEHWNRTTFTIESSDQHNEYFLISAPELQYVYMQRNERVFQVFIEHCGLSSFPRTVKNLPLLQKVTIRFCRLRYLNLNDLLHVRMLKEVDLSHNHITVIFELRPSGGLLPTSQLFLANNSLHYFDMAVVGIMPELICLQLNMNKLQTIDPTVPLPALQELSVAQNRLKTLNFTRWSFLPALRNVYANNNQLTSAPAGWRSLTKLETLELSSNYIRSFRMDDLYLTRVRILNLAANVLSSVTTSRLHLRIPLESLQLSYNRLVVLDISRWDMPNLLQLNVAHNQLIELRDAFVRFPNLILNLRHNSWSCEWLGRIHEADLQRTRSETNEPCPHRKHMIMERRWICCWDTEMQPTQETVVKAQGVLVPTNRCN